MLLWGVLAAATTASSSSSNNFNPQHRSSWSQRFPGHSYAVDDEESNPFLGREFDLFDSRGGTVVDNDNDDEGDDETSSPIASTEESDQLLEQQPFSKFRGGNPRSRSATTFSVPTRAAASSSYFASSQQRSRRRQAARFNSGSTTSSTSSSSASGAFGSKPAVFQNVQDWWTTNISPNIKNWPKLQLRVEPTTTLKIRKTFRPLKTIVRFGADFNTQLGVWQFKSSWEDAIIGGKLTLAGRELQLTKSWQLSVGTSFNCETKGRILWLPMFVLFILNAHRRHGRFGDTLTFPCRCGSTNVEGLCAGWLSYRTTFPHQHYGRLYLGQATAIGWQQRTYQVGS